MGVAYDESLIRSNYFSDYSSGGDLGRSDLRYERLDIIHIGMTAL